MDKSRLAEFKALLEEDTGKQVTIKEVGWLNVFAISATGLTVAQFEEISARRAFADRFAIEYDEPDFQIKSHSPPNDALFKNQWGLQNTEQALRPCDLSLPEEASARVRGADINVNAAWALTKGSKNIAVAVIDTGVDYNHPDLSDNIWYAPSDFSFKIGGDMIDCKKDSHGFNAIENTCDPMDNDGGHGTHVAGIIGAVADNEIGVAGVNPKITIIGVRALDSLGGGCASQVVNAIDFLIKLKQHPDFKVDIRVVNNSYGFVGETIGQCEFNEVCESRTLREAISEAGKQGILFVASAGNDYNNIDCRPVFPASFKLPNIISVAASDSGDSLASFSNYGPGSVHLAAPGKTICSTIKGSSKYSYMNGTSVAAPFVTGTAALVLSRCNLSTADLKDQLLNNVARPTGLAGKTITGGRLDAGKAVSTCVP
jgi:subtilisin family serine protease